MTEKEATGMRTLPWPQLTWSDSLRYFAALVIGHIIIILMFVTVFRVDWSNSVGEEALRSIPLLIILAIAVTFGHALPSDWRGRVSLMLSSLLTGVILVVLNSMFLVENIPFGDEFTNSAAIVVPMVLIAHILRIFVPFLRPYMDGKPVRYFGKSAPDRARHPRTKPRTSDRPRR